MRVKSIIKGWWRYLFRERSERSKDRLLMCKMCELRKGRFCGVCWCELDALSELDPEELGVCKHPNGSKWSIIDFYWENQKRPTNDRPLS